MKINSSYFFTQNEQPRSVQNIFLDQWFNNNEKNFSQVIIFWNQHCKNKYLHSEDWYMFFFWVWTSMVPETPADDFLQNMFMDVALYYRGEAGTQGVAALESFTKSAL